MTSREDLQRILATEPASQRLLITAPAGSGKTQALAMRVQGLLQQGCAPAPHRVLAVTFSIKATDNLRSRISTVTGRQSNPAVDVRTLHSLAARVTRAHGHTMDVDGSRTVPHAAAFRLLKAEAGIDRYNVDEVTAVLTEVKRNPDLTDDEVLGRLAASGVPESLAYEESLRGQGLLDYDVLRYGAQLLRRQEIAGLYAQHYSAVIVDEVQDLSLLQLEMVEAVAAGRTTYAGDEDQGIYTFAGAEPEAVFAAIRGSGCPELELEDSFRSSPAVLKAVNALAGTVGGRTLTCADPARWGNGGTFIARCFPDQETEAGAVLLLMDRHLAEEPRLSIGVMARTTRRLDDVREVLGSHDIPFQDWSSPTHVPRVIVAMKRAVERIGEHGGDVDLQAAELAELSLGYLASEDVEGRVEVLLAVDELRGLAASCGGLALAVRQCRSPLEPDRPVEPGVHLLTGHAGKGQEFDVVVVVGLENGKVPFYLAKTPAAVEEERRVLHVMLSRAKRSLYVTRVEVETRTPSWKEAAVQSPWWAVLESVST